MKIPVQLLVGVAALSLAVTTANATGKQPQGTQPAAPGYAAEPPVAPAPVAAPVAVPRTWFLPGDCLTAEHGSRAQLPCGLKHFR